MNMIKITYSGRHGLCTEIFADEEKKVVKIKNYTENVMHRAFGVKEVVTWEDLELFLERRCFSRHRWDLDVLLNHLGLEKYDPWEIVKKTEGRMAKDNYWLKMELLDE